MASKASKTEAAYVSKSTSQRECCDCRHFLGILGCQKVQGLISPHGWCKYFESRKEAK
jgi:hypothetical protein